MSDPVIFDVDGTLCDVRSVRHFVAPPNRDFHAFHVESTGCPPNWQAQELWHANAGNFRIVVTARNERYRVQTVWWLLLNDFHFDAIYFRGLHDQRPDFDVKRDILQQIRRAHGEPVLAVDDNPSVIELWRQEAIPFIQIPGWV